MPVLPNETAILRLCPLSISSTSSIFLKNQEKKNDKDVDAEPKIVGRWLRVVLQLNQLAKCHQW
jgi:hypothetical protein